VVAAHRAGVKVARPIYTLEVEERPDIVVASSHPADRDLWQGFKPLNNCGMLVKDQGTLILLIPAPEGIAPDHPYLVELGLTPGDVVCQMVEEDQVADCVAAATYLAYDRTRRRVRLILVSDGIPPEEGERIGLEVTGTFEEALAKALAQQGNEARIGVVTHGADVMGQVDDET
jgi:nickel-dependent lactate racemase